MVQTTSVALICLLVAPSLAVPITNEQHARAEDLSERAVGAVRKVATPSNIANAGKFAAGTLSREDAQEISQRDLESPEDIESLVTRADEIQFTDRDIEYLKDLAARDPNWFKSAFRAVRKIATPPNLMKAGKFAAGILMREDEAEGIVIRDDEFQLTDRDVEFLMALTARDPYWFKSAFRAVRKIATPPNLMKAGKFAAGILFREDEADIAGLVIRDDEFEFTEREIEYLKDLSARDPNWFSSAVGAVRKVATPSNLRKVGKVAANLIFREDAEEFSQRDVEYEDLSTREPKTIFTKIKEFFSPKRKASKDSKSEEVEGRDDDDVFERYFDDYEIDELD
jgi:hypothetical protein